MCQRAHSDNRCQWTIQQTSRNCYSTLTVIHKLTLLLNISHAIQAKSNSHLFNIQLIIHVQEIFLFIHILFILCINTGNFYSVFSSLQDVITCTYMTCKNKVYKTPVHRLSSIYNDNFNSVHPKIQQFKVEMYHAFHWEHDSKDNKQIIKAWLIVSGCAHHMASSRAAQRSVV